MARQCERPDCSARASVAYGFDGARRSAWYADLVAAGDDATTGALCAAHARAMVLPRGWWLDDRRDAGGGTLFATPDEATPTPARRPTPVDADPTQRPSPGRRPHRRVSWEEVQLPLSLDADADADADADGPGPTPGAPGAAAAAGPVDGQAPTVEPEYPHDADGPPATGDGETGDEAVMVPWRPRFDQGDDLGGVLAARSPLLARAFGGLRRSAPRPPERD